MDTKISCTGPYIRISNLSVKGTNISKIKIKGTKTPLYGRIHAAVHSSMVGRKSKRYIFKTGNYIFSVRAKFLYTPDKSKFGFIVKIFI